MDYHIPVMLKESINGLNIKPDGIYLDLTFVVGGHSKFIYIVQQEVCTHHSTRLLPQRGGSLAHLQTFRIYLSGQTLVKKFVEHL